MILMREQPEKGENTNVPCPPCRAGTICREAAFSVGVQVHFEFVGITDLMSLGCEADEDEVWYEIRRMKDPMQRQEALIPEKHLLDAFRFDPDLA